jgi:hypothetical protein
MKRLILAARIGRLAFEYSARVLPNFAAAVPMKAKLRKLGGGLLILRLWKRNPDPLPDNLGNLERPAQTALQQIENLLGRQLAIQLPLRKVDAKHAARLRALCFSDRLRCLHRSAQLFGTGLKPRLILVFSISFHGLFFVLCCSVRSIALHRICAPQQGGWRE